MKRVCNNILNVSETFMEGLENIPKNVLKTSLGREVKTSSETVARNLAMKQVWNFALETSLESSVISILKQALKLARKLPGN